MMDDFKFELAEPHCLDALRELQLTELHGPVQEFNEEGIITYKANFVRISKGGELAGYACIGTYATYKDIILEYFLTSAYRNYASEVLLEIARSFGCTQWIVNTQDFFALPVLLDLALAYKIDAYLFAVDRFKDETTKFGQSATFSLTGLDELQEIYKIITQDGFYTGGGIETVEACLKEEELYSLRINNKLIGVGFVSRITRTPSFADIAMIIDTSERHKGWGTRMVTALIKQCKLRQMTPTAVCSAENLNSRRTLEKAGFYLSGCTLLAKLDRSVSYQK
jgi:RimJ/RimL family protein N-acetyltransferase